MHIHVCPLATLKRSLKQSSARWMISLSSPGKSIPIPDQIDQFSDCFLSLEFNDISEEHEDLIAPTSEDIEKIINFSYRWNGDGTLLIQCWMGISRSTAAALIVILSLYSSSEADKMAILLRTLSPTATPNFLMIRLADNSLNLDGRLVQALQKIGRGIEASHGIPFDIFL
ncbi:protein tyrosine phosphatase [Candidatus Endowatersipora endosymbiont of Watersipora subatra]|uniref:tyrosine phosphatase family protein n=1 Tax=Candidatus Endowatersipora endosymbiont of Watersipora subatra TaxID=3077946 RepID=UPI00312C7E61